MFLLYDNILLLYVFVLGSTVLGLTLLLKRYFTKAKYLASRPHITPAPHLH